MLSGFELYPRWLPLLILPKRTCAQLRTRTSTSICLKKCYVKLEFQILYAGEQFSSLIFQGLNFCLSKSANWVHTISGKLR